MQIEFDVDDIDLSRADQMISNLFGMAKFSISGEMSQIDHLIKKYGVDVSLTGVSAGSIKWQAKDSSFEFPPQYGARAIEAAVKMLIVKLFTNSSAIITFDLVLDSATPDAAIRILTAGSPYHSVRTYEELYVLQPNGNDYDDVESFQTIVKRANELATSGHLHLVDGHMSNDVGDNMVDSISFVTLIV